MLTILWIPARSEERRVAINRERGADSGGTILVDCCVLPLCCGGSGVCYTLISCAGGGGSCGMGMLKMTNNCFSDTVCLSPSCDMGLDGDGLWRFSVSSAASCVTSFIGERLGNLLCTWNICVVLETSFDAVLGM